MARHNLILVSPFLGNSIILQGFIDYLSDYCNLHFVDLPGFTKKVPPLEKITVENYARFVQEKIDQLALDSYIIGGVSFGFLVVSNLMPDARCKGVLALVPYMGSESLKLRWLKRSIYSVLLFFVRVSKQYSTVWRSSTFRHICHWYSDYPHDRIDTILDEFDGKTFFETAGLVLDGNHDFTFHDLPYVLILSDKDNTIHNEYLIGLFTKNVEDLLVVNTALEHHPTGLGKDTFKQSFPEDDVRRISRFFDHSSEERTC